MRLILLLLPLILVSCGEAKGSYRSAVFQSERLSHGITRLENEEVICYKVDEGGLSCLPK